MGYCRSRKEGSVITFSTMVSLLSWTLDVSNDIYHAKPCCRHLVTASLHHRSPTALPTRCMLVTTYDSIGLGWLRLGDCLTDWLNDWMTERLTDWLNDWLTDYSSATHVCNTHAHTCTHWFHTTFHPLQNVEFHAQVHPSLLCSQTWFTCKSFRAQWRKPTFFSDHVVHAWYQSIIW